MKKTMVILMVLGAALAGCKKTSSTEATETVVNDPAGVYTLVTVDGVKIPGTFSHGKRKVMLHSGSFIINADNTCVSKTVFGSQKIARQVKATYTQDGSTLNMQWIGAGRTRGTIKGDTFTMNNEGMIFSYKKQP
ncbi:MAG: hypothetical protein FVQ82_02460 [Planctomycetes bacterium]|nr:hypothetical protein [Planctomycetota bacterium]